MLPRGRENNPPNKAAGRQRFLTLPPVVANSVASEWRCVCQLGTAKHGQLPLLVAQRCAPRTLRSSTYGGPGRTAAARKGKPCQPGSCRGGLAPGIGLATPWKEGQRAGQSGGASPVVRRSSLFGALAFCPYESKAPPRRKTPPKPGCLRRQSAKLLRRRGTCSPTRVPKSPTTRTALLP